MFMVLSSWHSHCESSPGSFDECRLSAGWPPTLRPNQPIWAVSPPKDWLLSSADATAHQGWPGWVNLGGWLNTICITLHYSFQAAQLLGPPWLEQPQTSYIIILFQDMTVEINLFSVVFKVPWCNRNQGDAEGQYRSFDVLKIFF